MFIGINSTLDGIRSSLRLQLQRLIGRNSTPPIPLSAIKTQTALSNLWELLNLAYSAEKPYYNGLSLDDDTSDLDDWVIWNKKAQECALLYGFTSPTLTMCLDAVEIAEANIGGTDCATSVRDYKVALDKYAKASYDMYINMFDDQTDRNIMQDIRTQLQASDPTYVDFKWTRRYLIPGTAVNENDNSPHERLHSQFKKLYQSILNPLLDPSLRRFIVNQGPGSCGMHYDSQTSFMFMQPFLQFPNEGDSFLYNVRSALSSAFMDDDEEGDVEDAYQVELEKRFSSLLSRNGTPITHDVNLFNTIALDQHAAPAPTPGAIPTSDHAAPSTHQARRPRPRPTQGSGPGPHQGVPPPPPPPPPPTQPTIPDDTSYQPNSSLARKERDFISYIQSLPTMDMSRDHMTRFNTDNESPNALFLQDITRNDKTTFAGQNRFSQRYLITFTRMSRKPIFNPVT